MKKNKNTKIEVEVCFNGILLTNKGLINMENITQLGIHSEFENVVIIEFVNGFFRREEFDSAKDATAFIKDAFNHYMYSYEDYSKEENK